MAQIQIGTMEFANIRRAAQIVAPKVEANTKLQAKIAQLQAEYDANQNLINSMDGWVREKTGYCSTELCMRVVTPILNEDGTPKMDKEGKYPQKKTDWVYNPAILTKLEKGGYLLETKATEAPAEGAPVVKEEVEEAPLAAAPEATVFDPTAL